MRKVTTTVAAALVALGFVACDKKNNQATPELLGSGTYATISVSAAPLKADPDQNDETGREKEQTLATMDLIGGETKSWMLSTTEGPGNFWKVGDVYKTLPWEVMPGNKKLAVVLNKGTVTLPSVALFATATFGSSATAIDDINALSTDDKFVMASASANKTIQPEKDEATVKAATSEDDNAFTFEIERVVAQGFVGKATTLSGTTTDQDGKVKLDDITYSVMNGATKTFILADNAGARKMGADNQYKDFKSAIDEFTFADANKPAEQVKDNLIRIGALGKDNNNDLGGYKALPVNAETYKTNGQEANRGIYFLENSVKEDLDATTKKLGFARLATAKVYATFTPKKVWKLKANAPVVFEPAAGSKVWYKVTTAVDKSDPEHIQTTVTYTDRTFADAAPAAKTEDTAGNVTTTVEWKEGRAIYKQELEEVDAVEGADFFIGSTTGAIYDSIEAALAGHANKQVKTYAKGRCAYYALWNRTPNTDVKNGETRRNNIYSLTINSFKTKGMNFDPLDPKDPNLPQPNPNDPDNDPTPENHNTDIEPAKTFMRVDCKVLPWNLVSRKVDL